MASQAYLSELAELGGTADGTELEAMEHTGSCATSCPPLFLSRGAQRSHYLPGAVPDEKSFLSACKEAALIHWDLSAGTRLGTFNDPNQVQPSSVPLQTHPLLSSDRSCGMWRRVARSHLQRCKKPVTGVSFRKGSSDLYSCQLSNWNAESLTYIETLRTRVSITGIESVRGEAVTSGGLDRSLRVWKIPEETQLRFQSAPRLSTALLPGQRRVPRRHSVRESVSVCSGQEETSLRGGGTRGCQQLRCSKLRPGAVRG